MKKVLLSILFLGLGTAAVAAESDVLGFKAWKAIRVEEARVSLDRAQAESVPERNIPSLEKPTLSKSSVTNAGRMQKGGKGESRLQQAQINFEFAVELTINDYFVLYLSQLTGDAAILEAAKKLTPEEVAQLMIAYKKQLDGGRSSVGMLPDALPGSGVRQSAGSVKAVTLGL